eukprot:2872906-Prymnesium_polylepis.1
MACLEQQLRALSAAAAPPPWRTARAPSLPRARHTSLIAAGPTTPPSRCACTSRTASSAPSAP